MQLACVRIVLNLASVQSTVWSFLSFPYNGIVLFPRRPLVTVYYVQVVTDNFFILLNE